MLVLATAFVVSRQPDNIVRRLLTFIANLARETQKTYLALKQPPLRPPPYLFGPVWTLLYGLMGYSAHRAWTAGQLANSPVIYGLAKVLLETALPLIWDIAHSPTARGHAIYHPARIKSHMDAAIFRAEETHRGFGGYSGIDWYHGLPHLRMEQSGFGVSLGYGSVPGLAGVRYIP